VVNSELNIRQIRNSFTSFVENGTLDKRILDTLICDENFVPKECELWDYKRESGKDAVFLAETVLTIISFYNTYGGYIIYGIDEITDELIFIPYGINSGELNLRQLKHVIANYIGEPIDISYKEIEYYIEVNKYIFGILHIPKRPSSKFPVFFGKDGPEKKNGRPIFQKDDTYIRVLDQCLPATKKEHYQLLFSERKNDFLWDPKISISDKKSKTIIVDHNLPNRNFICPKFVGRENELHELWKWLGDELSNTKVLVGDGGKGKTSIAYEFAEEVCQTRPYNIEKIVWLTAKTRQFSGELDRYIDVPRTDFDNLETLLKSICRECAILEQEIEGASIPLLKKYIKNALENILCLIIIDNVDSIDDEQQKQMFETAMQFPGSKARFLLTTRINKIFSADQCISIGGFNKEDYYQYVSELLSRFDCPSLTENQINQMRIASNGSPLFTESILRLYKNGITIKQAIRSWQGKEGNDVRRAALLHEIERLSAEAKRILLATVYMNESSFTELRQVTAYNISDMQKYINELKSFFLLETKPLIKKESRFFVPENTARLVLEIANDLVPSPSKLLNNITKFRQRKLTKYVNYGKIDPVDAAINQARALTRDNNVEDAIETIRTALNTHKNHPDLLIELARNLYDLYHIKHEPALLSESRKFFKKSYNAGQRKEILFVLWFEADSASKDFTSATEIASLALQQQGINLVEWLKKRANVFSLLSKSLERALNIDLAIENMKKAARDIGRALVESNEIQKSALKESLYLYDDELWNQCNKRPILDMSGYVDMFDLARFFIKIGDKRFVNYERINQSLVSSINYLLHSKKVSHGQINLIQNLNSQTQILIKLQSDTFITKQQEDIETNNRKLQLLINDLIEKFR
jgi:hypothetical protein